MQPPEKRGYQISLVIRRVGGLEVPGAWYCASTSVTRRVGGLEAFLPLARQIRSVTRRVGGLEEDGPNHQPT